MAQLAKSTLLTSTLVPWDLFRSFKVCSDAEENGVRKEKGSYRIAAWIPEFAEEELPFSRTAALVPEFAVKDLLLGRIF